MKISTIRRLLLATTLAVAVSGPVFAQANYPSHPIKLVVQFAPGGSADAMARAIAQKLQEAWGQPAIVDNRPGASGTIANQFVVKAPADGHTILVASTALIQQPYLLDKLPYDPMVDLTPVMLLGRAPSLFAVPLESPAKTLKEFVALAKANPGKYNFGSYGNGTSAHIQGALLNMQAGMDLVHVPFSGAAPLATNLIGGQVTSGFLDGAAARPHLKSIRPLAVTGPNRMRGLPDVPTFLELGYRSFEPVGWFGLFVPAKTPPAVAQKLAAEVSRILRVPEVAARIEAIGLDVGGGTQEEFQKVVRGDAPVYAKIIKDANIRLTP